MVYLGSFCSSDGILGHKLAAGDLEIKPLKVTAGPCGASDFQRKSCYPPSPAAPLSGIKMLASCAGYLLRWSRHHHPLGLLNPMSLHTEGVSKGIAPSTYTLSRCSGISLKGKQEVRRPGYSVFERLRKEFPVPTVWYNTENRIAMISMKEVDSYETGCD